MLKYLLRWKEPERFFPFPGKLSTAGFLSIERESGWEEKNGVWHASYFLNPNKRCLVVHKTYLMLLHVVLSLFFAAHSNGNSYAHTLTDVLTGEDMDSAYECMLAFFKQGRQPRGSFWS